MTVRLNTAARNAACNAIVDLLDFGPANGVMKVYSGSPPAEVGGALTTQVKLADLPFSTPAFGNSSVGTATANAITDDSNINATGTATWLRLEDDFGQIICDMTIGISGSGADIIVNEVNLEEGGTFGITSMTFTVPISC
jgi:hypothetical protein